VAVVRGPAPVSQDVDDGCYGDHHGDERDARDRDGDHDAVMNRGMGVSWNTSANIRCAQD